MRLSFSKKFSLIFVALLFFISCGDSELEGESVEDSPSVIIIGNSFIPESLSVSPGDTVYFFNEDSNNHRILNESTSDVFDDTGVFDSGDIQPDDVSFIEIPEDAVVGTTFYFYCSYLEDSMTTPNGVLTVE